jgi:tetratricopeptide (TPR) repeat protein
MMGAILPYMILFRFRPVQNDTGAIITSLYSGAIPNCLSTFADENFRSGWNILIYLSLLLPTAHFWCGWLWYSNTFDLDESTNDAVVVSPKLILVLLCIFTVLAMNTMGSHLFFIRISGNPIMKKLALFFLWFIITSIISIIIAFMVLRLEDPSSFDRHGWIVTKSGLTAKDQVKVDEIQAIELDMSKCGQYHNATESLSRIIDNYELEDQQHRSRMRACLFLEALPWIYAICSRSEMIHQERFSKLFGKLYSLRGLLLYHHGKYKEALSDFNQSLTYNPNNIQIQFCTIFAHNMLGEYSEADLYIQKCIEKYKVDPANIESQWILATLTDYHDIIRQNYDKRIRRKGEEHRKVNIPPSQLFTNVWPTHLELAELSGVAYCKDRLSSFPLWSFIDEYDDTNKTGYYSIAVQHNETKEIVIAHRGTVFNLNNASLLADYALFILMIPEQFGVAQQFTDKIRRQMDPKRILWHTGHSLGGAIAEFLVANETLFKQQSLSFAITFDSPGIMEILEEYHHHSKIEQSLSRSDEFPVIGYLSVPNIVNTMGTHIGLLLRLSPAPLLSTPYHPLIKIIYTRVATRFHKFVDVFREQVIAQLHWHSLQTIIECFKLWPNKSGLPIIIKPVIKWPKGFQQLICFLDLASRHNLTTLDISKYLNKSHDVLNAFKRCNYHVIDSREDLLVALPLQLWNSEIQYFLEQFIDNDFKKKDVTTRLNPDCELVKYVGVDAMQIIFDILHWKTDHFYPDMKMIALNESAIPIYNEQIYKINILSVYKLFSLVNLDNCILSIVNSAK